MTQSIAALLIVAFLAVPARADHQSVAVYYCFDQEAKRNELSELYVFDSSTSDVLAVWDQDNFDDPDTGLDAWLEDSVGANWDTHHVTFYENVRGECVP